MKSNGGGNPLQVLICFDSVGATAELLLCSPCRASLYPCRALSGYSAGIVGLRSICLASSRR